MKRIIVLVLCCILIPVFGIAKPKLDKDKVIVAPGLHYQLKLKVYNDKHVENTPPPYYQVKIGDLSLESPQDLPPFQEGFAVLTEAELNAAVPATFPNYSGQTWKTYAPYFTCSDYYLLVLDRLGFGKRQDNRKNPPTQAELAVMFAAFNLDYILPKPQGLDLITTGECIP